MTCKPIRSPGGFRCRRVCRGGTSGEPANLPTRAELSVRVPRSSSYLPTQNAEGPNVLEAHELRVRVILRQLGGYQFFNLLKHVRSLCLVESSASAGELALAQSTCSIGGHFQVASITSGRGMYMRRITNHSPSAGEGSQFAFSSPPGDVDCR